MHRIAYLIVALVALPIGGCTVHHTGSASASARGSVESRSDERRSSPRAAPERRERPPAKLTVRPPRPAPKDRTRPAPTRPRPDQGSEPQPEPEPEAQPEPEPEEEEPVFGSPLPSDGSFEGNVYFIPKNSPKIPDLDALEPVGTVYAKKLDIAPRNFEEGFPGISDRFEWFAIRYTASVAVTEGGEYSFRLNSDDGSKLYVNGELVVNNDGQHAPTSKSGKVTLEPGVHDFVIEYFQGPRYQIALQLFVTPPGDDQEGIFSLE